MNEAVTRVVVVTGVSVTIAYPGVADTRIRYRGFNALGQETGCNGLVEKIALAALKDDVRPH